jgi:hypothetical protein
MLCARNGPIDFGGERGTRTLDLGIVSAEYNILIYMVSISYRVAPVAFCTTWHNEAGPTPGKWRIRPSMIFCRLEHPDVSRGSSAPAQG